MQGLLKCASECSRIFVLKCRFLDSSRTPESESLRPKNLKCNVLSREFLSTLKFKDHWLMSMKLSNLVFLHMHVNFSIGFKVCTA